jgi:hypothetical protein
MQLWAVVRTGAKRPLETLLTYWGGAQPAVFGIGAAVAYRFERLQLLAGIAAMLAVFSAAAIVVGWIIWRWDARSNRAAGTGPAPKAQELRFPLSTRFRDLYGMALELTWRTPGHAFTAIFAPSVMMLCLIVVAGPLFHLPQGKIDQLLRNPAPACATAVLVYALVLPLILTLLGKRRLPAVAGGKTVCVSSQGLEQPTRTSVSRRGWGELTSVRSTRCAIYFFRDSFPVAAIPYRTIGSQQQFSALCRLIDAQLGIPAPAMSPHRAGG